MAASRVVEFRASASRLAVIAATEATRERLETTAEAAGWDVTGGSLESDEIRDLVRSGSRDMNDPRSLAGTADPPNGAERSRGRALSDLVDALGSRLPDGALVWRAGWP